MSEVLVYTVHQGGVGAWSRYEFPYQIEEIAQLDGELYVRTGNYIMRMTTDVYTDETAPGVKTAFDSIVQWPWLDFETPGRTKQMIGVDIVGTGSPVLAIGYDQTNINTFTPDYAVPADTLPGMIVAMPVSAPSFSVRLTYKGGSIGQYWRLNSIQFYFNDDREAS